VAQLPRITHLQFLVLGNLLEGIRTGQEIRDRLKTQGARKTGPAFYQMMGRLEDSGFVRGEYDQQVIDGQIIKQRRYRITAVGKRAWTRSRDFYLESIRGFEDEGLANA